MRIMKIVWNFNDNDGNFLSSKSSMRRGLWISELIYRRFFRTFMSTSFNLLHGMKVNPILLDWFHKVSKAADGEIPKSMGNHFEIYLSKLSFVIEMHYVMIRGEKFRHVWLRIKMLLLYRRIHTWKRLCLLINFFAIKNLHLSQNSLTSYEDSLYAISVVVKIPYKWQLWNLWHLLPCVVDNIKNSSRCNFYC